MLPLLCDCQKHEHFISHQDMDTSYVVWIFPDAKQEAVFLRQSLLMGMRYKDRTVEEWLREKPYVECCRMISRGLLKALKKKPDYVAIVAEQNDAACSDNMSCEQCMGEMLSQAGPSVESIKAVAQGTDGGKNLMGQKLTELFQGLENKGFLSKK